MTQQASCAHGLITLTSALLVSQGVRAAVDAAQQAAALPVAQKASLNNRDYQVAHASFVIAYTKDNLAHVIYPGGVTQKDWAQDLPRLVKETWSSH